MPWGDAEQKQGECITDLPTECLKRILQRLSLTNIFRVMSVSREWHVAAKAVVRDWPVLRIIERQEMDNNSVKSGGGHGPNPQMLSSLMQMHNLRAFLFQIFLGKENQWDKLILQNSASLQRLEYNTFMVLPGQRYPRLERLDVSQIRGQDAEALATALPRISSIRLCDGDNAILHHVPHPQMMRVHLTIRHNNREAESLVQSLLKMFGLRHLSVVFRCNDLSLLNQLISVFRLLTHFSLDALFPNIDDAVGQLVTTSANLTSVSITGRGTTDETLRHLTRLQHLTDLCLDDGAFSAEAVCAFLAGPSRRSLQSVYISFRENVTVNWRMIRREIRSMSAETGRTARKQFEPRYMFVNLKHA